MAVFHADGLCNMRSGYGWTTEGIDNILPGRGRTTDIQPDRQHLEKTKVRDIVVLNPNGL